MDRYDAIVIGAGQAGVPLARDLAAAGWKTALVEREHVGGTCINEGCTPTKTMVASARAAHVARRAADYGVMTGPVSVDLAAVRGRKRAIVDDWRTGSERRLRATEGLELIGGEARFLGPDRVTVQEHDGGERTLGATRVFVNVGGRPAVPALTGLDRVDFLDSTSVMELEVVPEHLVILGGGYVALEFSQMFRRFGSDVTIVQRGPTILSREDPDVAESLTAIIREDGVRVVLDAQMSEVEAGADGGVVIQGVGPDGRLSVGGSHLLVATGRVPNTDRLDVAAAGLEVDARGYLVVDERLETSIPGIYALGDVNGGPAFTHVSYDDYRIVRDNLLRGGDASTAGRVVPYAVFTDPQLGRVGLSEREARARGLDVAVFTLPMDWVARALETDETRGFIKAVVERATDRVLGCAVLGAQGGEMMAVLQVAMMGGVTASSLREAVFAHPTFAEALNNLFAIR